MEPTTAWQKLFSMSSADWQKIPEEIRKVLGLDSRLGIVGGILCTQVAAEGTARFVAKLNGLSK